MCMRMHMHVHVSVEGLVRCASRSEIRVACWHSAQTQTCNNGVGALFCFNTVRSQPLTHLVVQAYVFREHALACRQSRGS